MRGLARFLKQINENEILTYDINFINFCKNSNFNSKASSADPTTPENDSSTVSKLFKNFYNKVVGTISGSDTTAYKGTSDIDIKYDGDLAKLKSLKDFMTKFYENTDDLHKVLTKENENCRNIRTVIKSLESNITCLDIDQVSVDDQSVNTMIDEPEAKIEEISLSSANLRESKDIVSSESNNDAEIHNLLDDVEDAIALLDSSIDALLRRGSYKKAHQTYSMQLSSLGLNEDSARQGRILEDQIKQLTISIEKIDENLKEEIERSIKSINENTRKFIGKLISIRKSHFEIQKEYNK